MRSKEDAQDYRYFPDPDLVPIHISDEYLAELKAKQPEFKDEKKARYIEEFGLDKKQKYKKLSKGMKQGHS